MQYSHTLRLIDGGYPASEARGKVWPGMTRPNFTSFESVASSR